MQDEHVLDAICNIGKNNPEALTVIKSFEAYLVQKVMIWGDSEASSLSVEFLIAFHNEMTTRLDVNHRVQSTKLSEEDIFILSSQPYALFVNNEAIKMYQGRQLHE